ncbi:hypothetical protein GE115_07150 [Agromyces sp. CFH 90414]|uniref:Uncharacterized protein n=1 Tax=Agromyces agglutinans TaxID=2662258 RepID=A0A6I2FF35_9MICO|nr:hypothetical protein [Agromyces agglutinans]MRG59648.1 hypothetical protein [Agromyces agglutinans]
MLDVVYLLGIFAVFFLIHLIAKGVEQMGPQARASAHRDAAAGVERR